MTSMLRGPDVISTLFRFRQSDNSFRTYTVYSMNQTDFRLNHTFLCFVLFLFFAVVIITVATM